MLLEDIARVQLANLPTPLEEAPRLAREAGIRRLLIKRDDNTGLALGGNKARKLEFLMAEAVNNHADVVLTAGGVQSNHARMTAAAACKLGMESILFLGGPEIESFQGNLLLNVIFGAEMRFMRNAGIQAMEKEMRRVADELVRRGRNPYVIPVGGSSPLGAVGYVLAIKELSEQLAEEDRNCRILVAVGSGGTLAGAMLGARLFLPEARVTGISVRRRMHEVFPKVAEVATAAAEMLGEDIIFRPEDVEVSADYIGRTYGVPSEAGNRAVLLAARTEGLVLDPVYTGKAMSGLLGMAKKGELDPDRTVIFLHTGGSASLFAFESLFSKHANCREIEWR